VYPHSRFEKKFMLSAEPIVYIMSVDATAFKEVLVSLRSDSRIDVLYFSAQTGDMFHSDSGCF
jgi:hypothetical protein